MDAFYVSVELRRRPDLRGAPVIVAGTGPRAVVTTASYEARRFGVGSAMPAAWARRQCPHGVFLAPDFPYYRAASAEVLAIVRAHVAEVETIGLDEAYLELTGFDDPRATMQTVVDEIEAATGLHASVGIGPNKLVAKVASDAEKPRGFVVLSRAAACERFAGAPCGLVPGIGPKTAERLQRLGIGTLGAAAGVRPAGAGRALRRPRRGRASAPGSVRGRLAGDTGAQGRLRIAGDDIRCRHQRPAALEDVLRTTHEQAVRHAGRAARCGRTIGIKVRLDDFSTHTRARTLAEPVADPERVAPGGARAAAPLRSEPAGAAARGPGGRTGSGG